MLRFLNKCLPRLPRQGDLGFDPNSRVSSVLSRQIVTKPLFAVYTEEAVLALLLQMQMLNWPN